MRSSPFARLETFVPPPDARRSGWLCERPFAHRGLHGENAAENSRSAFRAAILGRHGIECDVRLSRDGYAMVFHDAELGRLTDAAGRLSAATAAELGRLRLAGGRDRIETLAATLALVAGRAPLLIELKTDDDPRVAARLCLSVRHALEGYGGKAAVMSFDPLVGSWFARHAPGIVRGLVVGEIGRRRLRGMLRRLLSIRRARPHFLAYDVRAFPCPIARHARRRGLSVLAWTVGTRADQASARRHSDQIIFET